MDKLNKADLIAALTRKTKLSRAEAAGAFEVLFDEIVTGLADGKVIGIPNVGTLRVVRRKARIGTSPSTGQRMTIPESLTVSFKPSPKLRKKLKPVEPGTPGPKVPAKRPPAGQDPATKRTQPKKRSPKEKGA